MDIMKNKYSKVSKSGQKIVILYAILAVLITTTGLGCAGTRDPFATSSNDTYSALLVPDTDLELYLYAKQERSTSIPAKIINMTHDIKVESLAIWGLSADERMVFGAGLTFTNINDASEIFSKIKLGEDGWKVIKDNKIYVVQGSGSAAESLKSAILHNNFKYYTNSTILNTVAKLPRGDRTKMVAIAVAKPTKQVLNLAAEYIDSKDYEQMIKVLKLLNAEVIITGLYSPHQINIAKAMEVFEKGTDISALDVGGLVLIKSSFPSFIVGPAVKNALSSYGFIETKIGGVVLYNRLLALPNGGKVPVIVRVEGNYIFVTFSGQKSYAETLITSIY